jgi:thiosulfate/3-mercaptopyruvate sulfurtransferase
MAYNLMRYDHNEVYLLDGGLDLWMDEGRETSQEFPEVEEKEFIPDVQKDMFLTYDQFLEVKDHEDTCLLDARPLSMYTGESGPWIKNGHIPGAVNLPWASLMQSNPKLLKPAEKIKKMAEVVGATEDKLIICSCGTGREATNEYTIFKHLLGYPRVKVYEGSFTEWTSYPDNPVAKGKEPR